MESTVSCPTDRRSGFTLIEMSIVLVIIGLIVGGILVGRDMIYNASIRATMSDVEKLETAIRTFQAKYDCLPGDCADATDFFGTSDGPCPAVSASGTCNGNGDGSYQWIAGYGGESMWAEDQLYKAHLIELYPGSALTSWGAVVRPPSNRAYALAYIYTNDLYTGGGFGPVNGRSGNTITLTGPSGDCPDSVIESAVNAQQIDMKMDDGRASTGAVFGLSGLQYSTASGSCGAAATSCLSGTEYDTSNPDAECRMLFYWSN